MGPDRDWLEPTGDPTGEGEGPLRMLGTRGEAWGEKGDWAGLLCSPWLLVEPEALTAELRPASVPVGRSSIEPDRSWSTQTQETRVEDWAIIIFYKTPKEPSSTAGYIRTYFGSKSFKAYFVNALDVTSYLEESKSTDKISSEAVNLERLYLKTCRSVWTLIISVCCQNYNQCQCKPYK